MGLRVWGTSFPTVWIDHPVGGLVRVQTLDSTIPSATSGLWRRDNITWVTPEYLHDKTLKNLIKTHVKALGNLVGYIYQYNVREREVLECRFWYPSTNSLPGFSSMLLVGSPNSSLFWVHYGY